MHRLKYMVALISAFFLNGPTFGVTSDQILARVKAAENGLTDFRAGMTITEADKKTVSGMGEGYGDLLKLEKAIISYKKPDKIRYDGYARGIKATYIQNGYVKLILASMIKHRENVKNDPGKRQDTLDLGFLSSRLWVDNNVTVVKQPKNGVVKLKFDPKFGDPDKRHDMVWVDVDTLRVMKREKYRGSGELRLRSVYTDHQKLTAKLPIAVESTMYDPNGKTLGSVSYKDIRVNIGLEDSLFSTK
jgi:outer membrane lipoprotein-sorting protein